MNFLFTEKKYQSTVRVLPESAWNNPVHTSSPRSFRMSQSRSNNTLQEKALHARHSIIANLIQAIAPKFPCFPVSNSIQESPDSGCHTHEKHQSTPSSSPHHKMKNTRLHHSPIPSALILYFVPRKHHACPHKLARLAHPQPQKHSLSQPEP